MRYVVMTDKLALGRLYALIWAHVKASGDYVLPDTKRWCVIEQNGPEYAILLPDDYPYDPEETVTREELEAAGWFPVGDASA